MLTDVAGIGVVGLQFAGSHLQCDEKNYRARTYLNKPSQPGFSIIGLPPEDKTHYE